MITKMRFPAFLLIFIAITASSAVAQSLNVNEIRLNVEHDEAYTYSLERRERIDSVSGITNETVIRAEILPGSNVTFSIKVENTLKGSGNDIRNVVGGITIEDIDDGADIDEDTNTIDLGAGNDGWLDAKFQIPLDVDEGTYNVEIKLEGDGENNAEIREDISFRLEVEKLNHDLRITKVQLSPAIVSCDRKTSLSATIANLGRSEENNVVLEIRSAALGLNSFDRNIFLETSEDATIDEISHSKTTSIEVPKFFGSGTYPITINLYWQENILFDKKTVNLVVRDCGAQAGATGQQDNQSKQAPVQDNQSGPEITPVQAEQMTTTIEDPYARILIIMLAIVGLFVALIYVTLVVLVFKRKPKAIKSQ